MKSNQQSCPDPRPSPPIRPLRLAANRDQQSEAATSLTFDGGSTPLLLLSFLFVSHVGGDHSVLRTDGAPRSSFLRFRAGVRGRPLAPAAEAPPQKLNSFSFTLNMHQALK